jgi:hypothetical protein
MENLHGRLGYLTVEEEDILTQFKKELSEEGFYDPSHHDDHLLLRFLRARKFQIPLSKKMFIDYITWRKDFGTDELIDTLEFPEFLVVQRFYPRFYHRTDKLGRPIYVEVLGNLDVRQLFTVTNVDNLLRNHVYEYEKLVQYRLPACGIKAKRHVEQSCVIMDLKGVSLSQFASVFSLVKQVSGIAQNYYPEVMYKYTYLCHFMFSVNEFERLTLSLLANRCSGKCTSSMHPCSSLEVRTFFL